MQKNIHPLRILAAVVIAVVIIAALAPVMEKGMYLANEHSQKSSAVKAARSGVSDYYYNKYGEYPEITDTEPVWGSTGYIIAPPINY